MLPPFPANGYTITCHIVSLVITRWLVTGVKELCNTDEQAKSGDECGLLIYGGLSSLLLEAPYFYNERNICCH
jgi:hypothetical protein